MSMSINNDIKQAIGFFELVEYQKGNLIINGWTYMSDKSFDTIALFVNDKHIADYDIQIREDVGKVQPSIAHAKYSGFRISLPMEKSEASALNDIILIGIKNGEQCGKMATWFSSAVKLPEYPPHLMDRVVFTQVLTFFWAGAFKTFREFWMSITRHKEENEIKNMLDWGCGCGRLIPLFQQLTKIPGVHGCDIDREPIEWCKENLKDADFKVVPPLPPTDYPDNFFDLVIGYSVFTHLTQEVQNAWLEEMKRIIAPGGLLLVTTHGDFAIRNLLPNKMQERCINDGFSDELKDEHYDGDAPKNYYRGTFQTEEYTRREYGKLFEIVEYIGDGAICMQDLVLMKKR